MGNFLGNLEQLVESPSNNTPTVEPRFNEPLYNAVLGITNDILQPSQSYSKMYGTEPRYNEPRYNEPRYNEILVITNTIKKPKRKIYPDITNKCMDGLASHQGGVVINLVASCWVSCDGLASHPG